jgi:EmrB/QacA subfamily drug resistance transporter
MTHAPRWPILAVLCLAVFVINLDVTIVNAALPTLVRELGASTRELQWIVDAYNLAFAALVLAAGSVSDRYGRRGALVVGLAIFGSASAVGAAAGSPAQLTVARAVMGIGAAVIFPTTLSILSNVYTGRVERARAIGIWGATTGLGVAFGPITGGWLLEHYWWGSVFLAMAPIAIAALMLTLAVVPTSRDPSTPPLDRPGLVLSTAGLGLLVYTIIEAPERGWVSLGTLAGFAGAVLLLAALVSRERSTRFPMLDVRLFRNLRFSAACGSVTVAWFALFGFIFLITQYFQFLKAYSPLATGLRILPVAGSIAVASVVGIRLAVVVGNKAVVAAGLAAMGAGFAWVSVASVATPYLEIIGQMILVGGGLGLTTAPATEAIMGAVPKEKAGIGSAMNDATREFGGTLGVAVIGSVFASLYANGVAASPAVAGLPAVAADAARDSVGAALIVADQVRVVAGPALADQLAAAARVAYFDGLAAGCLVAAGVALAGAVFVARFLPARAAAEQTEAAEDFSPLLGLSPVPPGAQ